MQRTFKLNSFNPLFAVELTFTPATVIVLNNTDKSLYLRVGSTLRPGTVLGSYDREILPTANGIPSNVALPNNSYQFSGYLPTPTDTTKEVTVIFQGTANPFNNKVVNPFAAARPF